MRKRILGFGLILCECMRHVCLQKGDMRGPSVVEPMRTHVGIHTLTPPLPPPLLPPSPPFSPSSTQQAMSQANTLLNGWSISINHRTSGATGGSIDAYYHEPNDGKRYRSHLEVIRSLCISSDLDSDKEEVSSTVTTNTTKSLLTGEGGRAALFLCCMYA